MSDESDRIQPTRLALRSMQQAQMNYQREVQEILEMDAEAQGIDTDEYVFNQQISAWVNREDVERGVTGATDLEAVDAEG